MNNASIRLILYQFSKTDELYEKWKNDIEFGELERSGYVEPIVREDGELIVGITDKGRRALGQ